MRRSSLWVTRVAHFMNHKNWWALFEASLPHPQWLLSVISRETLSYAQHSRQPSVRKEAIKEQNQQEEAGDSKIMRLAFGDDVIHFLPVVHQNKNSHSGVKSSRVESRAKKSFNVMVWGLSWLFLFVASLWFPGGRGFREKSAKWGRQTVKEWAKDKIWLRVTRCLTFLFRL